ncbi:hypothetical protein PHYBLDRAFT_142808 [Phycomyces blakesleeanus NRRL 1555(-)]|uniref:Uncharacterized protein n=1 Tax=Phycomyces blakesleeanus (strain ATCC 8743b / DSM 1359 / FGSC 10004 / NBRC 33097 / NRRL 1555) TaxID=763407 RepID=A0A162PTF0_PHYB8|nr:hypothetical protein PHYBLDRAFT_142808 [Phycomyces blakesleeanus NRRL 1555(-)]OAD75817.1 hypothetical protein PHYBLDRAFT_142808 [Phycomyces blakesleeanus NRRL 1555(-)]|eukprot:XP_018293857.1 hypothetical protein PHYBLDRAFT_142808 [Phycomyces blakesleeanus NRRL 1555(-)]
MDIFEKRRGCEASLVKQQQMSLPALRKGQRWSGLFEFVKVLLHKQDPPSISLDVHSEFQKSYVSFPEFKETNENEAEDEWLLDSPPTTVNTAWSS